MKTVFRAAIAAAALLAVFSASATTSYCSAVGGNTDGLSTSNMTYNTNNANDCYGVVGGNDNVGAINALAWGTGWALAAKDEIGGGTDEMNTVAGIQWTVAATAGISGSWTLTGIDLNGSAPANLGDKFDFVGVLKGSPGFAAYFFDDVTYQLNANNGGAFSIVFENNGGNLPNLSHMSVYARYSGPACTVNCGGGGGGGGGNVPEPGSLALAGLAMTGLAFLRRRRQS